MTLSLCPTNQTYKSQVESCPGADFLEHQYDMINYTKNQCALIQVTSTPQGTQTFGLPLNLRRQTGSWCARKDSYSALILGNWMIKTYYDMMNVEENPVASTFTPVFIS